MAPPEPGSRPNPAAPAEAAPTPTDPSQRDTPFFEDDLPPDFWDGAVSFDDLEPSRPSGVRTEADPASATPAAGSPPVPTSAPQDRRGPAPPTPTRSHDGALVPEVEREAQVDASDDAPDDETSEAGPEPPEGAETFSALRQLFPGRILSVEPIDDDAGAADDGFGEADDGPPFSGSGDGDAVGSGVD